MNLNYLKINSTLAIFLSLLFCAYTNPYTEYNLNSPDKSYVLPSILNEISGITPLNENELACVQDELGVIYIYDLISSKITKEYKTNLIGDYEGIALVGNSLFLLRSDGVLIEYPDFKLPGMKIKEYYLKLPTLNNEGLCYDSKNNSLLIASKVRPGTEKENYGIRNIYRFDLNTKVSNNIPIIKLNIFILKEKAIQSNITIPFRVDKKTGKKYDLFNFRPSEIAIHPINGKIYVLSANDKLLLILDTEGNIEELIKLDYKLFNKPEGLAFLPDGTMLISNEAQKGIPTLLTFKYNE